MTKEPEENPFVDRSLDLSRFWRIFGLDMPQTESMLNEILLQITVGTILGKTISEEET